MEELYLTLRIVNAIGIIIVLATITSSLKEKLTEDEEDFFNTVRYAVASFLILINPLLYFLSEDLNKPLFRFVVLTLINIYIAFISAYDGNEYVKNKRKRDERRKAK